MVMCEKTALFHLIARSQGDGARSCTAAGLVADMNVLIYSSCGAIQPNNLTGTMFAFVKINFVGDLFPAGSI